MKPKLRVWVVFGKQLKGKQLKFGDGRARLLELIDERGSLRQAAAELRMSYRNAWGYLRELEKAAGFKFVERAPGGNPRSGMRLTARGSEFLARYGKFQRGLEQAAARHFERAFRGRSVSARPRPSGSPGSRARSARVSAEAG
jgi:molybdate transport system regulatory protein